MNLSISVFCSFKLIKWRELGNIFNCIYLLGDFYRQIRYEFEYFSFLFIAVLFSAGNDKKKRFHSFHSSDRRNLVRLRQFQSLFYPASRLINSSKSSG